MALAEFSGTGIVDLNGSIGNVTYSRNKYGTYAKAKKGAPSGSMFLVAWQTEVASLTNVWQSGMSDIDRQTWYQVFRYSVNDLAQRNRISGFDLYMSVNLNLFLIGQAPVITPPVSADRPEIVPVILSQTIVGTLFLRFASALTVPCAVYVTKLLPVGRMSTNQIYAYLGAFNLSSLPTNIGTAYLVRIGALTTSMKVFTKVIPISLVSGLRGVPQYASIITI